MDKEASPRSRLVIKETRRANLKARAAVSVAGILLVGGGVLIQYAQGGQALQDPGVSASLSLGVILLGVASLLAWRRSGEYEFVERVGDRIYMRTTRATQPVFDAPLDSMRFQCLVLPTGKTQLFLRDGIRAVEVGADMSEEEKSTFRAQMDRLLGDGSAPASQA